MFQNYLSHSPRLLITPLDRFLVGQTRCNLLTWFRIVCTQCKHYLKSLAWTDNTYLIVIVLGALWLISAHGFIVLGTRGAESHCLYYRHTRWWLSFEFSLFSRLSGIELTQSQFYTDPTTQFSDFIYFKYFNIISTFAVYAMYVSSLKATSRSK